MCNIGEENEVCNDIGDKLEVLVISGDCELGDMNLNEVLVRKLHY